MDSNKMMRSAPEASKLMDNQILIDKQNLTKTLTRSETFTRECDDDKPMDDNVHEIQHTSQQQPITRNNVQPNKQFNSPTAIGGSVGEFVKRPENVMQTHQITYSIVNVSDVDKQASNAHNEDNANSPIVISDCDKTLDSVSVDNSTPQPNNGLHLSGNCTSSDMSIFDGDKTVTPFIGRNIVNSTMVHQNKSLEISQTISPANCENEIDPASVLRNDWEYGMYNL